MLVYGLVMHTPPLPPSGRCEACCRGCCYSTPYRSLSAIALTALGLLGFVVSSIYGVVVLDSVPHLEEGYVNIALFFGNCLLDVVVAFQYEFWYCRVIKR